MSRRHADTADTTPRSTSSKIDLPLTWKNIVTHSDAKICRASSPLSRQNDEASQRLLSACQLLGIENSREDEVRYRSRN
jgi:hypothetical protein